MTKTRMLTVVGLAVLFAAVFGSVRAPERVEAVPFGYGGTVIDQIVYDPATDTLSWRYVITSTNTFGFTINVEFSPASPPSRFVGQSPANCAPIPSPATPQTGPLSCLVPTGIGGPGSGQLFLDAQAIVPQACIAGSFTIPGLTLSNWPGAPAPEPPIQVPSPGAQAIPADATLCPQSVAFTVLKDFVPNATASVQVLLACPGANVAISPLPASEAAPAVFTVNNVTAGTVCTATEAPVPAGYTVNQAACVNVPAGPGTTPSCTIVNTAVATPVPTPVPATPVPTATPVPVVVVPFIPQAVQNPAIGGIFNGTRNNTPTPVRPAPVVVAPQAPSAMPVLRPPSTGDAGLLVSKTEHVD